MRSLVVLILSIALQAVAAPPATAPRFENGLAQPVFQGQEVIRHNVWVEIPGLDTDRDGANDRIRAQISRPAATESGTHQAHRQPENRRSHRCTLRSSRTCSARSLTKLPNPVRAHTVEVSLYGTMRRRCFTARKAPRPRAQP